MRPVERGEAPQVYRQYGDAIDDLVDRLGRYCSYCERRLPTSLAVEHVVPKSLEPGLETTWKNFLLGCTNCNSVKSNAPTNYEDFLWPDKDNTFSAYRYSKGGFVDINSNLSEANSGKAQALADIVGLQRHQYGDLPNPAEKDKRWQQREEMWETALRCQKLLDQLERVSSAIDLVIETAKGYGFFSVWMAVFENDSEVRPRLIAAFTGTADCFDDEGFPLPRVNGHL